MNLGPRHSPAPAQRARSLWFLILRTGSRAAERRFAEAAAAAATAAVLLLRRRRQRQPTATPTADGTFTIQCIHPLLTLLFRFSASSSLTTNADERFPDNPIAQIDDDDDEGSDALSVHSLAD